MRYLVKSEDTIYDVALRTYGLDSVYKLVQDNDLVDIASLTAMQNIDFDETFIVALPPVVQAKATVKESNIKTIIGRDGQTIYDICLMVYGSLENLYKLLIDSKIDSPNTGSLFNYSLTFDTEKQVDSMLYKHLNINKIVYNTSTNALATDNYFEDGYIDENYIE